MKFSLVNICVEKENCEQDTPTKKRKCNRAFLEIVSTFSSYTKEKFTRRAFRYFIQSATKEPRKILEGVIVTGTRYYWPLY